MREVFITCFAFLLTLNFYQGSDATYGGEKIIAKNWKHRWMVSPLRKRLSQTHPLQQPTVNKWTFSDENQAKDRRTFVDQAFGRNKRLKEIKGNVNMRHNATNLLRSNHGIGFIIDRKLRPRNSLHNKEIQRFREVLRKRMKVKPRQDIEFLEDNQDTGAKQEEFGSPRYEEVTANDNSENGDQNGLSNSYVTVIDNIDGKDTDPYSTLSTDEAKNEYTNVENSINEGANEEFQMLGKEVNDVLGALTKSDSRINQVVDTKLPQAQGVLPFKQTTSTYNDKGDNVAIMDDGRQQQNSQSRPPGDITVIEDNDEGSPSEETRPVLSKPVWDAIKQVEKNFTYQDNIVQNTGAIQYVDNNFTFPQKHNNNSTVLITGDIQQAHANFSYQHQSADTQIGNSENETNTPKYLPPPEDLQGNKNLTHLKHALSDLENNLKIFAGSTTSSRNTTSEPEPKHLNDKSSEHKILLTGSAEQGPEITSVNNENDHPEIQSSVMHFKYLPNGSNISNAKWHSYDQNGQSNSGPASNDSSNLPVSPWSLNGKVSSGLRPSTQTNNTYQNNARYQRPGIQMALPLKTNGPSRGSGGEASGNSGYTGTLEVGRRPTNNFVNNKVHLRGQKVNYRPFAEKGGQSATNAPAQKFPQGIGVANDDVTVTVSTPLFPEHSGREKFRNKTKEAVAPQGKPHVESSYAFGSQTKQRLSQENSANQFSNLQQGSSTFPWDLANQLAANDASLYGIDEPSPHRHDTKIQMQFNDRQPDHDQPSFVGSEGNEQSKDPIKSFDGLPSQNVPFQTVRNKTRSFDRWHEEFQSLIEKLRDLYGQAHGNSFLAQSASFRNNPVLNDTQQMMREVARFHSLFVGNDGDQRGIGRDNGMFFKNLKHDVNERNWRNGGHMSTPEHPFYANKEDPENGRDVSSQRISSVRFENNREVPGQIRSIQVANQTLFGASNSRNVYKQVPNMGDAMRGKIKKDENGKQSNENVRFVNQRLATRHRSIASIQLMNSSDTVSSESNSPSSHQVLMSYFRNETDLRKRLNFSDDSGHGLNNTDTSLQSKGNQPENNQTNAATKSIGIKTNESSESLIVQDGVIHNNSGLPKHTKNDSVDEEPLTKYLDDFISLLSSDATAERNETAKIASGSESSSNVPDNNPHALIASEASKKENVTDLKDRVIIVVSPKSIKDLMKNRSHDSSPIVHKGVPIKVVKAKNSTVTVQLRPIANKTTDKVKEQSENLSRNATTNKKVSTYRPFLKVINKTSNEDKVTLKSKNDDLNELYREELKSLEISLSRDFMSSWIYYQRSLDEIGITPRMLRSGIANLGSPQRLKRVFKKALAGTDLNVLVVGGSISAGGGLEKDRGNVEGVYHKAFSDWWNNTVTPITTSELKISAVAIGGTDSEYFSYCIQNYMRSLPDIVIWELAANDYKRYAGRQFAPAKPLEQLIRIILSLPSQPALILANFFRGNYYKTAVGQDCPDSEDEGGKSIAQYYKLTSLSWRNVICSRTKELDLKKLFSSDGYHPSLLGHAQMSTLLISYMKGVFEETISEEMISLRNHTLQRGNDKVPPSLAEPIFDDPVNPKPLCWTLLTPDYGQKLRNTLPDLEFTEATGFQFANISHWPIRRDRLRCLKAIQTGAMLKMKFIVPPPENRDDYKRELAITTHNSFGGMGSLWLDGDRHTARIIKEENGQRRTQVNVLTKRLTSGVHTVTVSALQPGFCLSAVAVL